MLSAVVGFGIFTCLKVTLLPSKNTLVSRETDVEQLITVNIMDALTETSQNIRGMQRRMTNSGRREQGSQNCLEVMTFKLDFTEKGAVGCKGKTTAVANGKRPEEQGTWGLESGWRVTGYRSSRCPFLQAAEPIAVPHSSPHFIVWKAVPHISYHPRE